LREAKLMFLRERLTGYLKDELVVGGVRAMRVLVRLVAGDDRWLKELVGDVRPRHVVTSV
jgi:hypothetical protein